MFGLVASALLMTTTSCETSLDSPKAGDVSNVSVTLGLPSIQSRAYSDGTTATALQYAVYDVTSDGLSRLSKYTVTNDEIKLKKQINFQLVTGHTYAFVFWAASADAPYTVDLANDGATMKVDYEGVTANNEDLDAFYAYKELTVNGDLQMDIKLYRPFAQINVGTSDYTSAEEVGYAPTLSSVTVSNVYNELNLVDGTVTGGAKVVYDFANIDTEEKFPVDGYQYLAMAYVLTDANQELVEVNFQYKENVDGAAKTRTVGSVPVQRNHRTNIYGQILTGNVDLYVEIVPEYEDPDYPDEELDMLKVIAALGGSYTLQDDIELGDGEYITFKKDAVVDLNGKTVTGSADGLFFVESDANLTIKGNGKMILPTNEEEASVAVWAYGGTVTIESGYFESNDGALIYAGDRSVGGTIYIKGGTFKVTNPDNYRYTLNCNDAAYRAGLANIIVTGGTFYNFDPSFSASENPRANFVAPGYTVVKTPADGDDNFWYTVVAEGTVVVEDNQALAAAVKEDGAVVKLLSGEYTLPHPIGKDATIEGSEGTVINVGESRPAGYSGVTFKNIKLVGGSATTTSSYPGMQHSSNLKFEDCEIVDIQFLFAAGCQFDRCDFTTEKVDYNVWTYTSTPVTFNDCTFNCAGKAVLIYHEGGLAKQEVNFNNCKFFASAPSEGKAAIEIGTGGEFIVNINNCTAEGFGLGSRSNNSLWNHKAETNKVTVTVDDEQVYTNGK